MTFPGAQTGAQVKGVGLQRSDLVENACHEPSVVKKGLTRAEAVGKNSHGLLRDREKEDQIEFGEQPEQGNEGKRGSRDGLKVLASVTQGIARPLAETGDWDGNILGNPSNETSPLSWVIVKWGRCVCLQRQKPGLRTWCLFHQGASTPSSGWILKDI